MTTPSKYLQSPSQKSMDKLGRSGTNSSDYKENIQIGSYLEGKYKDLIDRDSVKKTQTATSPTKTSNATLQRLNKIADSLKLSPSRFKKNPGKTITIDDYSTKVPENLVDSKFLLNPLKSPNNNHLVSSVNRQKSERESYYSTSNADASTLMRSSFKALPNFTANTPKVGGTARLLDSSARKRTLNMTSSSATLSGFDQNGIMNLLGMQRAEFHQRKNSQNHN